MRVLFLVGEVGGILTSDLTTGTDDLLELLGVAFHQVLAECVTDRLKEEKGGRAHI